MRWIVVLLMAVGCAFSMGAFPDDSDGPYPVRWMTGDDDPNYAETDSSRWLVLIKDNKGNEMSDGEAIRWVREHGGLEHNNLRTGRHETLRRFRVYTDQDFQFEDVVFERVLLKGVTPRWIAKLSNVNVVGEKLGNGAHQFTLRNWGEAKTHLRMYSSWDALPIWNGYPNALAFISSDGDTQNANYADIAEEYGVGFSAYIIPDEIGGSGALTWGQVRTMHGQGVEIGAHAANDGFRFVDFGGYGWIRCRPGAASVNQFESYPGTGGSNVDDVGMHDGDATREAWKTGGGARYETYGLTNMPAAVETTRFGAIDSVIVWAAWRVVSATRDTLPTGTRQVRFAKSSPNTTASPSFFSTTVTLAGRSKQYQMVRTKLTTDGNSKPLYWTNVRNWVIGPSVAASDSTLYCTQFFMDIHYGDIKAPRFDEWGLNLNPTDFVQADTLLGYELVDAKKLIEDQLRPTSIGYVCRGVSAPYNYVDGKSLSMLHTFYDYARSGYRESDPFTGLRDSDRRYPSWWDLQRYEIVLVASPSSLFGAGASFTVAQVDSAVQSFLNSYHDASNISINGGSYPRKNVLFVTGAHGTDECTSAQFRQFIKTVQADGRYWMTTLGDAVDYWTKAQNRTRYNQPR